jgi:sucrose phosphorylase
MRPVVARLLELMRFRNSHTAFDGEFAILATPDHTLGLEWKKGTEFARLTVDLAHRCAKLSYSEVDRAIIVDITVHETLCVSSP